jgi:glutamine synthetase
MTPDQIVAKAEESGIQLVRFLYCDNGGVIRGKSTHVGQLARRMQSGIGLVKGMQSFTSLDTLAADASYGPVGEIPRPSSSCPMPRAAARCS